MDAENLFFIGFFCAIAHIALGELFLRQLEIQPAKTGDRFDLTRSKTLILYVFGRLRLPSPTPWFIRVELQFLRFLTLACFVLYGAVLFAAFGSPW